MPIMVQSKLKEMTDTKTGAPVYSTSNNVDLLCRLVEQLTLKLQKYSNMCLVNPHGPYLITIR